MFTKISIIESLTAIQQRSLKFFKRSSTVSNIPIYHVSRRRKRPFLQDGRVDKSSNMLPVPRSALQTLGSVVAFVIARYRNVNAFQGYWHVWSTTRVQTRTTILPRLLANTHSAYARYNTHDYIRCKWTEFDIERGLSMCMQLAPMKHVDGVHYQFDWQAVWADDASNGIAKWNIVCWIRY